MKKRILLNIIFVLFFYLFSSAQEKTKNVILKWNNKSNYTNISTSRDLTTITIPTLINNSFDGDFLPVYSDKWLVDTNLKIDSYKIENVVYKTISKNLFTKESRQKFPNKIKSSLVIKNARNKSFVIFKLTPIVLKSKVLKKIISFDINYQLTSKTTTKNTSTVHDSPLATGNWFKFAVDTTGVFKLSKSFINSLGLDTSGNPKNIKIYGNGGNMLNELNSDFRYDDLQENAIYFNGEEDGNFDSSDYILFYAQGPEKWTHNNSTNQAEHLTNVYSNKAYYFITTSEALGKRIQPETTINNEAALTITTSNAYRLHEKDNVNFDSFGQQFFGESFQIQDTRNFSLTIPDLILTEPIKVKVRAATSSTKLADFTVSLNETTFMNFSVSPSTSGLIIATANINNSSILPTNELIELTINYNHNGDPSAKAYLDYIEINGIKKLIARDKQFAFRNYQAAQTSGIIEYVIENKENIFMVWNVTDHLNPSILPNQSNNNNFSFKTLKNGLNEYAIVNSNDFYTPENINSGRLANQNLHAINDIDYLIICPNEFKSQAERLTNYYEETYNYTTLILNPDIIYNEFSSGAQDITAIRDFVRHLYTNASSEENKIKYLLMFGDTSFDHKNIENNNNDINLISYQSINSFNLARSFVTDDYFGMMNDNEGFFAKPMYSITDLQDLAIGRIPSKDVNEAKFAVDRILNYYKKEALGKWRNIVTMVTDDIDDKAYNFNLQETTELIADMIKDNKPVFNINKIYSDAFLQQINAGGERYPEVKEAITNSVERGTLLINYFGHGGENGWASERFLDVTQVSNWYNPFTIPLFITITCEFSRLDNPVRNTAGEYLFSNKNGGSVNMLTTTREVYISPGDEFNKEVIKNVLEIDTEENLSIAETFMNAKNNYFDFGQRLFVFFFGDPAMKLPIPKPNIKITEMNGTPVNQQLDTIKALSHVYFKGIVAHADNTLDPTFNGELFTTIYDKSVNRYTLNNDNFIINDEPAIMEFDDRQSKIFNGKTSIVNGIWEFDFIAPRDIRIAYGDAKLSFYAKKNNDIIDKAGYNTDIVIGGINQDAPADNLGPKIKLYMNDESFVDGGNTNQSPLFLAVLADDSGINTSLTAVDHDIIAILDDDETNPIILNDFYETELNDFTKGKVKYPFRNLAVGNHHIKFKCWDTYNNSAEATLNFVVVSDSDLILDHVLNYPNPFVNYTEFWFNHNKPNETIETQIQIFTVSGKLIKTINRTLNTPGLVSGNLITWNGLDNYGNKIGKGVYIYKLTVKVVSNGLTSEKIEKLVILQ